MFYSKYCGGCETPLVYGDPLSGRLADDLRQPLRLVHTALMEVDPVVKGHKSPFPWLRERDLDKVMNTMIRMKEADCSLIDISDALTLLKKDPESALNETPTCPISSITMEGTAGF